MITGRPASLALLVEMLEHLVAIHLGHHDVEQHNVEILLFYEFQRLAAAFRGGEIRISEAFKSACQGIAIVFVIVYDEQGGL